MKSLLKKIFRMGNKENASLEDLTIELDKYSYQWMKGDTIGQVNHFKELIEQNGQQYVCFTDGSRIAYNLLEEYIDRVEKGFYEAAFDKVQPQILPPNSKQTTGKSEVRTIKEVESPIASLLKKQKENWVDVDLNLTINLPKKSLWDVILSSFDNAEEEIIEYVTKDLDIEVVREALKKSIKDIYSAKTTTTKNVRTQNTLPRQSD